MEKEFLSHEQVKALIEIGFNEPCGGLIYYDNEVVMGSPHFVKIMLRKDEHALPAPTYSQAFRWFRDNHGLYGFVNPKVITGSKRIHFTGNINHLPTGDSIGTWVCSEAEWAESELKVLKKLIKMINDKQYNKSLYPDELTNPHDNIA